MNKFYQKYIYNTISTYLKTRFNIHNRLSKYIVKGGFYKAMFMYTTHAKQTNEI